VPQIDLTHNEITIMTQILTLSSFHKWNQSSSGGERNGEISHRKILGFGTSYIKNFMVSKLRWL
jgi:hypothetical protein